MAATLRRSTGIILVARLGAATALLSGESSAGDLALLPRPSVLLAKSGGSAQILDANDDGLPDLVRASSDSLVLFEGTSPFALKPPARIADEIYTINVRVGDFDSDGESDVVSIAWSALDVFTGAGDGSFAAVFHEDLPEATRVAMVDVNADGHLDLLISTYEGNVLTALGDGAGGFQFGPAAPAFADWLAAADLDADGFADFAGILEDKPGVTAILHGDGTGQFTPWSEYPTPGAQIVGFGSLDGDGLPDLVWNGWQSGGPHVQLSLGSGQFGPPAQAAGALSSSALHFGDFDEDGDTDILSGDLLSNDGAGTFAVEPGAVPDGWPELAADLDADGRLDVVSAEFISGGYEGYGTLWGNGTLFVTRGLPGPAFEVPLASPLDVDPPEAMLLADLDADGRDDFVLAELEEVHVLPNLGAGQFGAPVVSITNTGYGACVARAAGDFDGDGLLDLLGAYDKLQIPVPKGVRLLHGLGDSTVLQGVNSFSPGKIVDIDVADLDLDGDLDPVLHKVAELATLLNDGSGKMIPAATADADEFSDVAVGDADGDGFPDVALARQLLGRVQLLPGTGGGLLGPPLEAFLKDARSVRLGDLDGDGRDEIAVARAKSIYGQDDLALLSLQPGLGLVAIGSLELPGIDSDGATVEAVRDVTGDGYADVLLSSQTDLTIVASDGAEGLQPARSFHTGGGSFFLGLIDGDPYLDVLTIQIDSYFPAALLTSPGHPTGPWTDLGHALAGAKGAPALAGFGTLQEHSPVSLQVTHAAAGAPTWLLVGTQAALAPFKGGTLVPSPELVVDGLVTDAQGRLQISAIWPAGVPAASSFYVQAWIADAAGPAGFAASNGFQIVTP